MTSNDGERLAASARRYSYIVGPQDPTFSRDIAIEAPIEISFGGAPFAVMMGTPTCLEDFAIGFALTEGIIDRYGEVRAVEPEIHESSAKINVTLSSDRMRAHLARKRSISGRTGCGVCGIENLDQLPKGMLVPPSDPVSPLAIGAALDALESAQPLNALTRSVHGAAWCRRDGSLHLVREDVGRHNALDKCIGALLRDPVDPADGFFVITSRCSFEMVAKTARFGAGTLVSLSAPTSLALQHARECGVTLIVTARADHATVFEI